VHVTVADLLVTDLVLGSLVSALGLWALNPHVAKPDSTNAMDSRQVWLTMAQSR